jgi:hypothetical protein
MARPSHLWFRHSSIIWCMSEMLCRQNFLTCFSPVIFSCFATRWLWLLNQTDSKRCCGSRLATCSSNTLNQAMEPYWRRLVPVRAVVPLSK